MHAYIKDMHQKLCGYHDAEAGDKAAGERLDHEILGDLPGNGGGFFICFNPNVYDAPASRTAE